VLTDVLSADKVFTDWNLAGQDASYGMIGFGAYSPLWQPYTSIYNNQSMFSIALARSSAPIEVGID
jgi:hypothetical protein